MPEITINPDTMPYSPPNIECLRFGGRVGGQGIGTCAIDMFQGFSVDPDDAAMVPLTNGDSLTPLSQDGKQCHFGPTNKDVFLNYLRTGTFDKTELPNHAFIASIAASQLENIWDEGPTNAQKWLAILKENGFEFIRAVDNSVYSGGMSVSHPVYIFALFRNIGRSAIEDPYTPPEAWQDLPEPELTDEERWDNGAVTFSFKDEPKVDASKPSPFVLNGKTACLSKSLEAELF